MTDRRDGPLLAGFGWIRRSRTATLCAAALAALAVATLAGLIALWPSGEGLSTPGPRLATERATVVAVDPGGCRAAQAGADAPGCRRVTVRLESGADAGTETAFDVGEGFDIASGDPVRVTDNQLPPEAVIGGVPADAYSFADFERRTPLLALTAVFAVLVLIAARWRGLRALAGLGASLAVIVLFVVPAIVEGSSPVLVATVGCLAILLVTIPLTHGITPVGVAAALATAGALLLTLLLAEIATATIHITGFGTDEAAYLQASLDGVSIRGLLLAGIVIATLGVLDDLTITQASTVAALRRADPDMGARRLTLEALRVGRDHVVAVVNTLVLAYAGASLPVLIVFSLADTSVSDAVNTEAVASEAVATLVGSIGLIAAVPLVTGLAAVLASSVPPEDVAAGHHHHHHP